MAQKFQRKQYLIDLPFQMNLIIRFSVVVLITALSIGVGIFVFTQSSTTVAIENTRVLVKPTSDFILPVLTVTIVVVALCSATVVIVMMLFISHRIVGPIYRLKKEIVALKDGSLKRNFSTREKDKLKDLSRCLQEMADSLHSKQMDLRGHYQALADFIKKEENNLSASGKEKLVKLLSDLEDKFNYFKI